MALQPQELERVARAVMSGQVRYCPHGRPVAIELTGDSWKSSSGVPDAGGYLQFYFGGGTMPPKILVIVGPTASGKTRLAVELAHEWNGEVVSADSMQVYRRMDIGTAKPTAGNGWDPHHMIDVADPGEDFSAARYVEMASACVDEILARASCPSWPEGQGCISTPCSLDGPLPPSPRTAPAKSWRPSWPGWAGRPCWPSWPRWIRRPPHAFTPTTTNVSSGPWRCSRSTGRTISPARPGDPGPPRYDAPHHRPDLPGTG